MPDDMEITVTPEQVRAAVAGLKSAIDYVWDDAENYWPATSGDPTADLANPFSAASGIGLFEAAHRHLHKLGIRTPRIVLADQSHDHYPADIAVVEDVPGENLETQL